MNKMKISVLLIWSTGLKGTTSNDGEVSRYLHVSTENPSTVTGGAATARVPWAHTAAQVGGR